MQVSEKIELSTIFLLHILVNLFSYLSAKQELADETSKTNQLIDLLKQDESIYDFEKLDINSKTPIDIDANTQQKAGYLNLRS